MSARFRGFVARRQSATAGEFRYITWDKTDLVHDFHSVSLFDLEI